MLAKNTRMSWHEEPPLACSSGATLLRFRLPRVAELTAVRKTMRNEEE
jgi:hypothetical protein